MPRKSISFPDAGGRWALSHQAIFFLLLLFFAAWAVIMLLPRVALAATHQTLGDLNIGDRVTDNTWVWEHRPRSRLQQ